MSELEGQDVLRELVAKWRKAANAPGMGEYYQGKEHAFDQCADELEAAAALSRASSPSGESSECSGDGSDCHHCDEPMPNGRCWWCGGPNKPKR